MASTRWISRSTSAFCAELISSNCGPRTEASIEDVGKFLVNGCDLLRLESLAQIHGCVINGNGVFGPRHPLLGVVFRRTLEEELESLPFPIEVSVVLWNGVAAVDDVGPYERVLRNLEHLAEVPLAKRSPLIGGDTGGLLRSAGSRAARAHQFRSTAPTRVKFVDQLDDSGQRGSTIRCVGHIEFFEAAEEAQKTVVEMDFEQSIVPAGE